MPRIIVFCGCDVQAMQTKSILDIARELNELQQLGQDGKLTQEHLSGGTFSLSNIGTVGGTYLKPVLVVPQVWTLHITAGSSRLGGI